MSDPNRLSLQVPAREYFEKVAGSEDLSGIYYLGMLYLKGIGVERDVKQATKYFLLAANAGLPKAIYQIAKMLHAGAELKKNMNMLKMVANFLNMNAKCNEPYSFEEFCTLIACSLC